MMVLSRSALLLLSLWAAVTCQADELTREETQFFEAKIRPVLIRECYGCHSNQTGNARGGLRLDTRELMRIGGSSGPAVVPRNLEESWLYNAITHQDYVMPPKRKLSDSVIADFKKWIEMGAPDPRVSSVAEIRSSITQEDIQQARDTFWAYQHPVKTEIPKVDAAEWPKTDIDRYILVRLEQSGLNPSPDADALKVRRRLGFDLIGLPPTPAEIESFSARWQLDPDRAIAETVDQLLQQPQFGERWGRHWLDVARYAESTGREVNMTYPHAWRYRDYVIDSFNNDKPYHEFVQEQLAGDLLPVETDEKWAENLVATTFLAIGSKNVNEQNRIQFEADLVDEQIDATTRVFLGMSVACARCHDHKFDAIPQTDYYALAGVFGSIETYFGNPASQYGAFSDVQARRMSGLIILPVEDPSWFDKRYTDSELADLNNQMVEKLRELADLRRNRNGGGADANNALRARLRATNELAALSAKLAVVDENGNPRTYCMGVLERREPQDAKLLVRGEIDKPAQSVSRGFPQVLLDEPVGIAADSSGRLQLARWIGSDRNPLTARVMVNRIWQHMTGRGIVSSTENFGTTGQLPSHPELLDYLAVRFVESGWSVKSLIRDIAVSRVYRMQTTFNESYHEYDPDNALLWRANPRRLDAEALRDAMLFVSGELDLQRPRGSEVAKAGYLRVTGGVLGNPRELVSQAVADVAREAREANQGLPNGSGAPFRPGFGGRTPPRRGFNRGPGGQQGFLTPSQQQEVARRVANQLDMEDAKFRSVYLPIVRDEEPRSLDVFDGADSSAITGQRESSNTANQALYMLNNRFVIERSDSLARRVIESASSPREQIETAFRLTYGRGPTPGERSAAAVFLRGFVPTTDSRASNLQTLSALCQSLLASAEFRFLD